MGWLLASLGIVFAVDRGAKVCVSRGRPERLVRNARPGWWPGGSGASWIASVAFAFAAAVLLVALHPSPIVAAGLGAALGGALGNVYDRLRHGAVLDFLHVGFGGRFNPADIALVGGIVVALVSHVAFATSLLSKG